MARQRRDKLLSGILDSPTNVRVADACKAAAKLEFAFKGQTGSHIVLSKTGEPSCLTFQDIGGGKIPSYQAKQLGKMIARYWDFDGDCLKAPDVGENEGE